MSDEIKQTSEEVHSVCPQPADTCPLLDKIVQEVEEARRELRGNKQMNEDELKNACDYIERNLDEISYRNRGYVELVRDHVAKIRQWGQEWKVVAKDYFQKKIALEAEVEELREKIKTYEPTDT